MLEKVFMKIHENLKKNSHQKGWQIPRPQSK